MTKPLVPNLAVGTGRTPASDSAITIDPEADEITGTGQAAALAAFRELDPPAGLLGAPELKDLPALQGVPPVRLPAGAVPPDYEEREEDLGGLIRPFLRRPRRVESLPPVGGDWRDTFNEHFPEEPSPQAQATQPNPTIVSGEDGDWPLVDDRTDETAPPTGKAETDPVTASGAPPVITMRVPRPPHVGSIMPGQPLENAKIVLPEGREVIVHGRKVVPWDDESRRWIQGASMTGMPILAGRGIQRRLVAVYAAVKIRSISISGNTIETVVDLGFGPFITDADERAWGHKLVRDNALRLNEFEQALASAAAHIPPRVGRVYRWIGGPPMSYKKFKDNSGYHWWYGADRCPTKFEVDDSLVPTALSVAKQVHARLEKSWWTRMRARVFNREEYKLWEHFRGLSDAERSGAKLEDGLTRLQREYVASVAARRAAKVVGSLGSIALGGKEDVRDALNDAGLPDMGGTMLTYGGDEEDSFEPLDEPPPKK